jgi:hypothetical protein
MRYTIRNIPPAIDAVLRSRAKREGKSLNQVAIDALHNAARARCRKSQIDLSDVAGTWIEDPGFDRAMKEFGKVDKKRWKRTS